MKKKQLLIVTLMTMALCLAACGKTEEAQVQTETQVETDTVEQIKEEITGDESKEANKNEHEKLIIDNTNSKYVDENAADEETNKINDGDPDEIRNDGSEKDATATDAVTDGEAYKCNDNVNVTVPTDYTVEDDGSNIMMTNNNIRICINMSETSLDKENRLQEKLTEAINDPETPFEAGNSGRYNDCVRKNETYTVIDHYYSNKSGSNIYIVKMTSDDEEKEDEYNNTLRLCYYIVASDIKTDDSMMVARTSDITEDDAIKNVAINIFGKK